MHKPEMIKSIATGAGVSQATADKMLKAMQESVQNALQHGEKVALRGFGTFVISDRAARRYLHPYTGEKKIASAYRTVRFVPSSQTKSQLN